jgi:hypothetical protein
MPAPSERSNMPKSDTTRRGYFDDADEVDLAYRLDIIGAFEGYRKSCDPGPLITTTSSSIYSEDVYHRKPVVCTRSSSISSIGEEIQTPVSTRSNSVDESPVGTTSRRDSKENVKETADRDDRNDIPSLRSPPNAKLIRRGPSPVQEPSTSLRKHSR